MNIPLKTWLISFSLIASLSFIADYFFIHYLFKGKKEAQIEMYNKQVDASLEKNCSINSEGSETNDSSTTCTEK